MNVLRWGTRMIERSHPATLVMAGAALALTFPPTRNLLRSAAVAVASGVIGTIEQIRGAGARFVEEVEDIVAEAKERTETQVYSSLTEDEDHEPGSGEDLENPNPEH
ncbi:MAG TPA: hypothetical protein PKA28_03545 [Methylomusa anaerophila]|uniref:DUF5132 domain-containing protein n=1 Tax=Methylomusa anaerophila TaxID=1930071 RepID=A0A348ANJ8_9FIRM|nr:hypothetical protein [Methylomusa anaerophila]BBB92646.1 hypothetical protein MAMMFC1_03341 [Methylomusa anaerophila]HML87501.1 hypothetical protein [Methylomusa anaerophila]